MYETHFGISGPPFQLSPDPSFYFGSKQHSRAKAYLEYGVSRNEGFIVITGETGAGKTTILSGLLDSLAHTNVNVGQLVTTQLDAEDTLRMVGAAFGFRVKDVPKSELLITLEAFLISQTSKGKRCLLIVDEAQNLSPRAVEELRMLSNFQFGNQALLQSFLVGQPEFREILQQPEMEQFRQRVAATCHIGPLDADETRSYVEHRLKCAGAEVGVEIAVAAPFVALREVDLDVEEVQADGALLARGENVEDAAADGQVTRAGWAGGYGRQVRIAHGGGLPVADAEEFGAAAPGSLQRSRSERHHYLPPWLRSARRRPIRHRRGLHLPQAGAQQAVRQVQHPARLGGVPAQGLGQPGVQALPVRQPGERVVEGEVCEVRFVLDQA